MFAFFLITRNALRLGVLTVLTNLAMSIGKVITVGIVGATTYFILSRYYVDSINTLVAPTIITMFVSYAVAGTFTSVYHSVSETMIQCFITGMYISFHK